jgi:hypothetical protein
MAFQPTIKNDTSRPFSGKDKKKGGWKWFHNFVPRHPPLSLPKPQATPTAREKGFTPENDLKFFYIYEPLLEKIQFSQHHP